MENCHVTEVVTLLEGEWSYRGGQFYGGSGHFKGVLQWRESGHVMEVVITIFPPLNCPPL